MEALCNLLLCKSLVLIGDDKFVFCGELIITGIFWLFQQDELLVFCVKLRFHFVQSMPNITPHVCRHTYCSNQAKAGMNPKTLQYLMGHSDISVTMNVYTHVGLDDAEEELRRMEEFRKAQAEVEKKNDIKPVSQKMFKAI